MDRHFPGEGRLALRDVRDFPAQGPEGTALQAAEKRQQNPVSAAFPLRHRLRGHRAGGLRRQALQLPLRVVSGVH